MLIHFPAAFYISSVEDENGVLGFRQVQVGQHMDTKPGYITCLSISLFIPQRSPVLSLTELYVTHSSF